MPLRLAAGQLAATWEELRLGTALDRGELRDALALGQKLGLLELLKTPWGLRIEIVNWHNPAIPGAREMKARSGNR